MNASQISCFFSLGLSESTQRLPGCTCKRYDHKASQLDEFFQISPEQLEPKKITTNHPYGFLQPLYEPQCEMEPAWLPRHCWDQRFFHPGNPWSTRTTKVKSHPPKKNACMITRTCRPPSQADLKQPVGHLWRCCFLDQKKSFSLQLVEHEFQECFRILPRNN